MEVATQQNAKLLTLLQQNEKKAGETDLEKESVLVELKEIKKRYVKTLR